MQLLPYQSKMIEISRANKLALIEHAPRIGATFAFAYDAVEAAVLGRPQDYLYMGMPEEFMSYCAEISRAKNYDATSIDTFPAKTASGDVGDYGLRMRFRSGRDILAVPTHPINLRRYSGPVLIDEAGFVDDLERLAFAALETVSVHHDRLTIVSRRQRDPNHFFNILKNMLRRHEVAGTGVTVTLSDALEGGIYRLRCSIVGEEWSPEGQSAWEANLRRVFGETAAADLDLVDNG